MSAISASSIYRDSLEAIAYQGKTSPLYRDLTFAFQRCIDERIISNNKFGALGIDDIIFRHTGIKAEVKLDPSRGLINACAYPIILDSSNPFTQMWHELGYTAHVDDWTHTQKRILPFTRDLKGSIDLGKSRVTGVFSKIPTQIYMGDGLWTNTTMTAAEIAAICLHEIGHVFTFFEMLLHTTTTNLTLMCAKRDINRAPNKEERLKLVFEVANVLGARVDNAEKLADPRTQDADFIAIYLSAISNGSINSTTAAGAKYDLRSSEVAADQWANRHGAGLALTMGLAKLPGYSSYKMPIFAHAAVDILMLTARIAMMVFSATAAPIMVALAGMWVLGWLAVGDPEFRIYDDPAERLHRIRKDIVQILKSNIHDKKVRAALLQDLNEIDPFIAQYKDYRSIMNRLWIFVGSNRRAQYKQMRLEQELESISNNNLFVAAAKLQQLNDNKG